MISRRFYILLIALLAVFGAAGCQPAQAPTESLPTLTAVVVATPTQPGYPAPAQAEPGVQNAYPVDEGQDAVQAGGEATADPAYPAPEGGPAGAPAVPNRAKVTARLIEAAPDADNPSYTRLHVSILSTEDVAGMQNFTSALVNQEADLYIETTNLPALQPGDQFTGMVTYNGDERGGMYFVSDVQKLE